MHTHSPVGFRVGLSISAMLYLALLLALSSAHAWNDCAFPEMGYYAVDEGLGLSFAYGADGMNGKLYTGGYYKGHFALTGVTGGDAPVSPEPSATLWGDVTSDVQARIWLTAQGTTFLPPQPVPSAGLISRPRSPLVRTSTLRRRMRPGR